MRRGLSNNRQVIFRGLVEKFYGRCSLLTGHSEARSLMMLNGTFVLQRDVRPMVGFYWLRVG